MAEFFARVRATYDNFDGDVTTPQTLVRPAGETYNPLWFHPRGVFDDGEVFRVTDRMLDVDDRSDYPNASRAQKALIKLELETANAVFGTVGFGGAATEMVDIPIFEADRKTLVSNGSFASYFGFTFIDGEFFLAVSHSGDRFTLYGSPSPGFVFPETFFGFPRAYLDGGELKETPTEIISKPFRPDGRFTDKADVWNGDRSDDVADLLRGSDVADGMGGNDVLAGGGGADRLRGGNGRDDLFGNAGRDEVWGGNGNDLLFGGGGGDFLDPGRGPDRMTGGKGNDDFIFADRYGRNVVTDFDADSTREDIVLRDVSAFLDWQDLKQDGHMAQVGRNVVIDDFAGTVIVLLGTDLADLDRTDFVF